MTLGERVRAARLERKMTVAALAGASGLSKGFISQVERGLALPSLDSLRRIAASLDVAPQSLMSDADPTRASASVEELPPVRFPASTVQDTNSSLVQLTRSENATYATVTLTAGSAVTQIGGKGRTQGFLTILSGVAVFSSAGGEESLQPGDMLGWNAAQSYRIENTGHSPLALVLVFEHGAPLPTVTEPVPDYYANLQQAANRVVSSEGPLRLAAMRRQVRAQG